MICNIGVLEILQNTQQNTFSRVSFLKKCRQPVFSVKPLAVAPMDILTFEFELNKTRFVIFQNVEWFNKDVLCLRLWSRYWPSFRGLT